MPSPKEDGILDEAQRLRGGAWGFAYEARMYGDDPGLSDEVRRVYRWAEESFLRIAQSKITEDEAVCGYGA